MLKKTLQILKENPVIILFYAAYIIIVFGILYLLYPHDLSGLTNTDMTSFDFMAILIVMVKMLTACILLAAIGVVFMSGYGGMLAEAVVTGKTSSSSFLPGIRKFFTRTLLSFLLLFGFSIGVSILVSIVTVPITIIETLKGRENVESLSLIISLFSSTLMIFCLPFVALWFPALYLDNTGVTQSLKNGAKAGVKNYWKLVLILLLIYLPIGINLVINFDSMAKGRIFTPGYILICLLEVIISIFILVILFLIYKGNRTYDNNLNTFHE